MKNLIKKILRENEWEWAEETLDQAVDPYRMDVNELVYFLNQFFQQNKSPRFNRTYVAEYDRGTFTIGDETGLYVSMLDTDETFYYAIKSLKRSIISLTNNRELLDEYQDLYDTLIPLIKEDIMEQANDMDWFNIDDMPEPKGIALANIIEEYFKDNNLPYHIMIRQDNAVIYIKDTNFIYFSGWTELFTMDNIINDIMIDLDSLQSSKSINRWNILYNNLKSLFDKLK